MTECVGTPQNPHCSPYGGPHWTYQDSHVEADDPTISSTDPVPNCEYTIRLILQNSRGRGVLKSWPLPHVTCAGPHNSTNGVPYRPVLSVFPYIMVRAVKR